MHALPTMTILFQIVVYWAATALLVQHHEPGPSAAPYREIVKLDGDWTVSLDDRKTWHPIQVPGTIEDQIDVDFDGISIYRKTIPARSVERNRQLLLEFEAVATIAEVRVNGQVVAEHVGGWTPFYADLTELAKTSADQLWTIEVVCDERVGHNTQGFLPVFAPHFGGIWKSVNLIDAPAPAIDDHGSSVSFQPTSKTLEIEVPVMGSVESSRIWVETSLRRRGSHTWYRLPDATLLSDGEPKPTNWKSVAAKIDGSILKANLPIVSYDGDPFPIQLESWSPQNPTLYEVRVELRGIKRGSNNDKKEETRDRIKTYFAVRQFTTHGDQLLLNGQAISIRGLLNWGYAPPGNAPSLDESFMRNEIKIAHSRGFNLMKFCLWIPPKRYLELCDELGMLSWIEYPTWHPDFSEKALVSLRREYDEFFHYDRVHPSVVLRSLTCETGPSADIHVVRELYELCKRRIPGAIVEDDSSWIAWNRVNDFYDDHPYGNNHTWIPTLDRLKKYISDRETKPLILGESMAADTWCDPRPLLEIVGDKRPFWLPQFLDGNLQWLEQMKTIIGAESIHRLFLDSNRYAMLMRKYQMEAFRREVPFGGYVVSVIRDIPFCGMGLVDFLEQDKQAADQWNWHGDTMLLLKTNSDHRSFYGGSIAEFQLYLSRFGQSANKCDCVVRLLDGKGDPLSGSKTLHFDGISLGLNGPYAVQFELPAVSQPIHCTLTVEAIVGGRKIENRWPIWVVPTKSKERAASFTFHKSVNSSKLAEDLPRNPAGTDEPTVLVTHVVDLAVIQHLRNGGHIVLLPNNEAGSLPTRSHWFLRGAQSLIIRKF